MKRYLFTLIIIGMTISLNANNRFPKPDFAFPQKVADNASANLASALEKGDEPLLVRSLIDYAIARNSIDNDSMPQVLARIEDITRAERRPSTRALLNLLSADIYSSIYNDNRWIYDGRQLPASTATADYTLWSGNEFREKILALTAEALADTPALQQTPITDFAGVITVDKDSERFYPTLYDFAAYKSIYLLRQLSPAQRLLSISWLCDYDVYRKLQFNYQSPVAKRILTTYQQLLGFHEGDDAPFIMADINRIDFVADGVYYPDDSNVSRRYIDLLSSLYERFSDSEYSAEALLAMQRYSYSNDEAANRTLYARADSCIKRFPRYFRVNCLKNLISSLSAPEVNAAYRTTVVPGDSLEVTVGIRNSGKVTLEVYKVPYTRDGSANFNMRRSRRQAKLIDKLNITTDKTVPFRDTVKRSITFPEAGTYVIVPVIESQRANFKYDNYYSLIHCTSLAVSGEAFNDMRTAYVTNPKTGAPVTGGVKLTLTDYRGNTLDTATTGIEDATATLNGRGNSVYATKGTDIFACKGYLPEASSSQYISARYSVDGFTDLALYHPGDTMQWSAVARTAAVKAPAVAPGVVMRATLIDANRQEKDSATVTTDAFGRAEGKFAIPSDGLTGSYSVIFTAVPDVAGKATQLPRFGSVYFTVSDYKLPTYEVEITNIMRDTPAKGDITLKGKAVAYSGFPLADCKITVDLKAMMRSWWWRSAQSQSFHSEETATGSDGTFSLIFPAELLASSPIPQGFFSVGVTATSPAGENRTADCAFSTGKPDILYVSMPANIDISQPVTLKSSLTEYAGDPVTAEIRYTVKNTDGTAVADGTFMSDRPVVDFSKVKSGTYNLEFAPADTTLADAVTCDNIVLYRPTDRLSPSKSLLWAPLSQYVLTGGNASLLYGTTGETQHIRYAVYSDSTMLKQGWLKVEAGMHRFDYTLPDGVDRIRVTLSTNYGYEQASVEMSAVRDASIKEIKLAVESFRDKIVPGSEERWTFTVRDRGGSGVKSAIMLDMYCKALDAITPYNFNLLPAYRQVSMLRQSDIRGLGIQMTYDSHGFQTLKCRQITEPRFEMWGQGWSAMRIRGFGSRKYAASDLANTTATGSDMAVMTDEVKMMSVASAAPAAEMEEAAIEDDAEVDAGTANEEEMARHDDTSFSYRAAETPLAFFRPMLTTDSEGNLSFSFTAPDANTTWQLCALAYTRDLLVSSLSREIVASKPVMVQPNMPRFLRVSDRAVISASVMNNTDSTANVATTVEIFDPFTGETIAAHSYTSVIGAGEAATVDTEVNVAEGLPALGYRIKSSTGTYADGEQSMIPVLSSIAPVIDTMPFYVAPDSTEFAMELPAMPSDATVTLQFCNNPAWYVVTALPGLRDDDARDALSSAAAIFSAAIAEGVLKSDPAIAEAIKEWNSSDRSDSTLVSMLERNSDLKTILLNSTPWVTDARNDTERMERLALLFDPEIIKSTYDKAVRQLSILEAPRGGWSWMSSYKEPSVWITENITGMMGHLKQLGFLPGNTRLREMIDRGVSYLDREMAATIKEYPGATDFTYSLLRTYYPELPVKGRAATMVSNTVAKARADWKKYDAPMKAIAATLLYSHKYRTAAHTIIESLRQYATVSPEKGMWWPSLDDMTAWSMGKVGATTMILQAFNTVEPNSADVERIRQWLILQKEAKDWGNSVTTSEAVAAILLSGKSLTSPAGPPVISVGGRDITPDAVDSRLGYFREDISGLHPSGKRLEVTKQAGLPSWGAVYCRYRSEMSEIKPESCDDLSIGKELFVSRSTAEGTAWETADSVKVGDVIQVNLTVIAKRDMDYVAIIDDRGACFEPVVQIPEPIFSEGICFYLENRDASTGMFINHLPKGTYRLSYNLYVNNAGTYSAGVASIQSQYAPALSAHSGGSIIHAQR